MLVFCEIPKRVELFKKLVDVLVEDIRYCYPDCPEHLLQCYALHQIENELSVFSRNLADFNLPKVDESDLCQLQKLDKFMSVSKTFCDEIYYSYEEFSNFVELCCGTSAGSLNPSQRAVFDCVLSTIKRS